MNTYTHRIATPGDAVSLAQVNITSWQAAYRGIVADNFLDHRDMEDAVRRFERHFTEANGTYVVLEQGERVIGYVAYGPERQLQLPDYTGELRALYLVPAYQRQGLGKRLFGVAVAGLKAQGHTGMLLWVLARNANARGFYEVMGGELLESSAQTFEIAGQTVEEVAYVWPRMPEVPIP